MLAFPGSRDTRLNRKDEGRSTRAAGAGCPMIGEMERPTGTSPRPDRFVQAPMRRDRSLP